MTRAGLGGRISAMNGDQRRFAVLLGVLVVVATVFAGRGLFGESTSRSETEPTLPGRVAAASVRKRVPSPRLATATTTTIVLSADESLQLFETRDPFEPPRSPTPPTGQTFAVVDMSVASNRAPRAHVRVGSTVYDVGVGDTFAVSYKVLSLTKPCGQFLFGDSSFQLCAGEEPVQ